MDSCILEEQEVFFESSEAIPLSPLSENDHAGEEHERLTKSREAMAKSDVRSVSKYEVWQSESGSILERRERLFTQMGLKWELSCNTKVPPDTQATEERLPGVSAVLDQPYDKVEAVRRNIDHFDTEGGMEDPASCFAPSPLNKYEIKTPGSDLVVGSSIRLARSGSTGPLHINGSVKVDAYTVSRSISSDDRLFSHKLGTKLSIRVDGRNAIQEENRSLLENSNNPRCSGDLVCDAQCIDAVAQVLDQQDGTGLSLRGSVSLNNSEELELQCRIKDLDSGKEFVVNDISQDGSWNKLKELHTGRQLTFEEFESSLGFSPIVQEVMKREKAPDDTTRTSVKGDIGSGVEKKKAWFKVVKGLVVGIVREKGHHRRGSSDRVFSLEKSGRRYSSESNDDSQEALPPPPPPTAKRVKVHAHRKSTKDFGELYLKQAIEAHEGAIWTMRFSLDGYLLASAGQDKVVKVWEVLCQIGRGTPSCDDPGDLCARVDSWHYFEESLHGISCRKASLSNYLFALSEMPKCALSGHTEGVLDLSWSHSRSLLSSSMDKTVRQWNVSGGDCLRIFTHNDYVTCVHFNPMDDAHFISGSLDGKVRIWGIKEHQVVDWVDLSEMITAASYTPNGQGAVVGSYNGFCRFYKISDSRLQFDSKFEVHRKNKRRSQGRKITGFQFVPGDEGKLLITSSDSRIRVYEGNKVTSKYKGLRSGNSLISASVSSNGTYVICASEDSRVCIWRRYDMGEGHLAQKHKTLADTFEDFLVRHVSIAIPWAGLSMLGEGSGLGKANMDSTRLSSTRTLDDSLSPRKPLSDGGVREEAPWAMAPILVADGHHRPDHYQHISKEKSLQSAILDSYLDDCCSILSEAARRDPQEGSYSSATWPEDKADSTPANSSEVEDKAIDGVENVTDKKSRATAKAAWGLVIVTAGLNGQIQVFQNQNPPAVPA